MFYVCSNYMAHCSALGVGEILSNDYVVKPCLETEESLQADGLGNWELGLKQGAALMQDCVEQACGKAIS